MADKKELKKSNPYLVVQDNEFINFRHTLTVQEARVFLSVVAQVEKDDTDFKIYKIEVNQFIEAVGLKRKDMYSELKKVSDQLTSKKFRREKDDGSFLIVNYISSAEYKTGEGFVELSFDPKLKPFLLGLKSHFTQYDIRNILALRSSFSILLFQQLKQFERIGERTYNLIDLKYKLGVEDKYINKYNDFKRFVLETAQKEVKENCDIYFEYEEIKKGRKVESIKFLIYPQKAKHKRENEPIKELAEPKEEPTHVGNVIFEVTEEIQETPQQIKVNSSVPSMEKIQALGEKLNLTFEQINEVLEHYNHDYIRTWEAMQAVKNDTSVKSAMAYLMGSKGLGVGTWKQQQKKVEEAQEKELKRLISTLHAEYESRKKTQFIKIYEGAKPEEIQGINEVLSEDTKFIIQGRNILFTEDTTELNHFGMLEAGKILAEVKNIGKDKRQANFRNEVYNRHQIQINFDAEDKVIM